MEYQDYITDLHLNLHPDQIDLLPKWYEHSKQVVDFFTLAYYPYHMVQCSGGFKAEEEINQELLTEQWDSIKDFLGTKNQTDNFISFIGYEWQGTGEDGDHNIYFKNDEQADIQLLPRYQDLVKLFQNHAVIGIPHHLAYSLGNRGKNWSTHDERFSPFVEIYSHHGSSERDRTNLSMERHIHMGPRVEDTSVVSGLKQKKHFGIIASGDNHEVPAMVKNGRAGVWAEEYSKEAIWEAFTERRTYGFTDSKISVWMECEKHPMGSIFRSDQSELLLDIAAVANGKIERVELYKNGELDQIHIGNKGDQQDKKAPVKLKFQLECGWGPNVKFFPEFTEKSWQGELAVDGKILSVEPIYSSFDNSYEQLNEQKVSFQAKSQKNGGDHWMRDATIRNEGFVFEIEANPSSKVQLTINGREEAYLVSELLHTSHLIVFEEEAKKLLKERAGIEEYYRSDSWYHNAYKVKFYQAATEAEYTFADQFKIPVSEVETSYFVKVVQSDGQVAWGSPIWVSKS